MKACVITQSSRGFSKPLPQCDIAMFGFSALDKVDYGAEISGKSSKLQTVAEYSLKCRCGVLCGCITDSKGLKRKSVAVAADGKLLGITDMIYVLDGEDYKGGAVVGVYFVHGYRVGVCVENDLLFPEHVKTLAACGCNLICVHCTDLTNPMLPQLIRSYAYLYGVPIAMVAEKIALFADITGVIATSNNDIALFETSPKNCYRVVSVRRRGLFEGCGVNF